MIAAGSDRFIGTLLGETDRVVGLTPPDPGAVHSAGWCTTSAP
jgi:hypothetical protein